MQKPFQTKSDTSIVPRIYGQCVALSTHSTQWSILWAGSLLRGRRCNSMNHLHLTIGGRIQPLQRFAIPHDIW